MNSDGRQRSNTSIPSSSTFRRLPNLAKSPFRRTDKASSQPPDEDADHHQRNSTFPSVSKVLNDSPYSATNPSDPVDINGLTNPFPPPSRPLPLASSTSADTVSASYLPERSTSHNIMTNPPVFSTSDLDPITYPSHLAQTKAPHQEPGASSSRSREFTLGSGSTFVLGAVHNTSTGPSLLNPNPDQNSGKSSLEGSRRIESSNGKLSKALGLGKPENSAGETDSGGDEATGRRRRATSFKPSDRSRLDRDRKTITKPTLPVAVVSRAPPSAMYFSRLPVHGCPPDQALRAHTGTLVGDRIWFIGGVDGKNCWRGVAWLDTETLLWSSVETHGEQLPPLRAHTTTLVGDTLVIFGGGDGPTYSNEVWLFDTVSHRFSQPTIATPRGGLPPPRRAHTTIRYRNFLVVFGGGNGQAALNDVWALDVSDLGHMIWKEWKTTGDVPQRKGYHSANLVGDKMIVFGGSDGHASFADVHVLDLRTLMWTLVNTDEKHNRLSHTSTQVGSYLFVIGGHNGQIYAQDVLLLNLVTLQWETKSPKGIAPPARGYHVALLHDARILIFGGYNGVSVFGDTWVLDLSAAAYLPQVTTFEVNERSDVV